MQKNKIPEPGQLWQRTEKPKHDHSKKGTGGPKVQIEKIISGSLVLVRYGNGRTSTHAVKNFHKQWTYLQDES